MRSLLFLFSQNYRLLSGLLFFLLLPTANLIITPVVKAQSSTVNSQSAQGNNQEKNILEKKSKNFIELLDLGNYQQAIDYLEPELKKEVNVNNFENLWSKLIQRYGKYKNISDINHVDGLNVTLLKIEVNFENYRRPITLVFNDKEQIIGINIPQDQKDDTIEQLANKFVDSLATGDYLTARANLHPYLKAEFSVETIKQRWGKIDEQFGGFKQKLETRSVPGGTASQAGIAIVTIEFNNTVRNMFLIFDREKQIIGVDFENLFNR